MAVANPAVEKGGDQSVPPRRVEFERPSDGVQKKPQATRLISNGKISRVRNRLREGIQFVRMLLNWVWFHSVESKVTLKLPRQNRGCQRTSMDVPQAVPLVSGKLRRLL